MVPTRTKKRSAASKSATNDVRRITCGLVMSKAHAVADSASVFDIVHAITEHDWDHIFIVDVDGVPMGRIHAVDVLKIIARKSVNRNVAWMHATPATQLIFMPPLSVRASTPLLKAGALMLVHDLNQLPVVDTDGVLLGVVSHSTMSRHLPRFLL